MLGLVSKLNVARTRTERSGADRARRIRSDVAAEVRRARQDAGLSVRAVATVAGISHATLHALERGRHDPGTEVLARVASALGMELSVKLYPGTGPLIRDHIQAAMIEALLDLVDERWQPTLEVPVNRPVRGVIDLVLESDRPPIIACEAQSELRRLEQQVRWSRAKSEALAQTRGVPVQRLLLLRSTKRTRAVATEYATLLRAAYPVSTRVAYAALTGVAPWLGDAVLWCRVEHGRARMMDQPPRGIHLGR